MAGYKVFRDPIYEYITCDEIEMELVDSPWFQRLRHCSQNGPARLVYSSLVGTRFEHSLGVMELATRVLRSVLDTRRHGDTLVVNEFLEQCRRDFALFLGRECGNGSQEVVADVERVLRAAALCHDLAHFPLSHTLEMAFEQELWSARARPREFNPSRACHEIASAELVRQIAQDEVAESERLPHFLEPWVARAVLLILLLPKDVKVVSDNAGEVHLRASVFRAFSEIIVGHFDVDRLDYLQRDGHLSGTGFGALDIERLFQAMRLVRCDGGYSILPSTRGLSTVEASLIERYKELKWVCFHHKVLFYDHVACKAARLLMTEEHLLRDLLADMTQDDLSRYGVSEDTNTYFEGYLPHIVRALGNHDSPVPPLVVFKPVENGNYQRINGTFFVNAGDEKYFDDVWFSSKCRSVVAKSPDWGKFYSECLVGRRKCGMSLWKDSGGYQAFLMCCGSYAIREESGMADLAGQPGEVSACVADWLQMLLETGFTRSYADFVFPTDYIDIVCKTIEMELRRELEGEDCVTGRAQGVRALIAPVPWDKLFRHLDSMKAIDETAGGVVRIVARSKVLWALNDVKGEIPFFAYLAGEEADLLHLQHLIRTMAEYRQVKPQEFLLETVAGGFVRGLVQCWKQGGEEGPLARAWGVILQKRQLR